VYFSRKQDMSVAAILYTRTPGRVSAEAALTLHAMKVILAHDKTITVECSKRDRRGSDWFETPLDSRTLRSEMDLIGWLSSVQSQYLIPEGQSYIEPWRVHTNGSMVKLPNLVEASWNAADQQLRPPVVTSFTHADINGVGLDWDVSGGTPVKVEVQFLRPGDTSNPIAIVQGLPDPDANLVNLVRAMERKGVCHIYAQTEPNDRLVSLDMLDNEVLAAEVWLGQRDAITHIQVSFRGAELLLLKGLRDSSDAPWFREGRNQPLRSYADGTAPPPDAVFQGTFGGTPVYAVVGPPDDKARLVFDLSLKTT